MSKTTFTQVELEAAWTLEQMQNASYMQMRVLRQLCFLLSI